MPKGNGGNGRPQCQKDRAQNGGAMPSSSHPVAGWLAEKFPAKRPDAVVNQKTNHQKNGQNDDERRRLK
jgi:hypothetical protein